MKPTSFPIRFLIPALLAAVLMPGCSKEEKTAKLEVRAKSFVEAGELEKAKISYLNVLKQDPGNEEAITQLGRIWFEQGAPLRALPFLLKAKEVHPDDADLRYQLAVTFRSLGGLAEARAEAAAALEANPAHGEALILLAETCQAPEHVDEARLRIDSFPDPDSPDRFLAEVPLLLIAKDTAGAQRAVDRAAELDPQSSRVLTSQAALLLGSGNLDGAEEKFKAAADQGTARSPQRVQLADVIARRGRLDEARTLAGEITKQATDYIPAWMLAATLALRAGDTDEALAHLDRLFAIDQENFAGRMMQADVYVRRGEFAKAVEWLEKLEKAHPGQSTVKYQLARAHLQNGDPQRASQSLRAAIALKPDYTEAVFMLAQIDLRSGRPEEVVPAMRALVEKHPGLVRGWIALADALQLLGRAPEAVEVMTKVASSAPENTAYRLRLADALAAAGQPEAARSAVEKALEAAPGDVSVIARLVDMDLVAGATDAAQARVQALAESAPDSAATLVLQGRVLAVQNQWSEAEKSVRRALELDPDIPGADDLLVQVLRASGRPADALTHVEAVLARNPDNFSALRQAGLLYAESAQYDKSAAAYEKVLGESMLPEPLILNNLAVLYGTHLQRPDRAMELARQARELRASVAGASSEVQKLEAASIADTMGWLHYRQGDYGQAFTLCQEAAGFLKGHAEVQYHFGMAAAAMGETEAAQRAMVAAATGSPAFDDQDEARWYARLLGGEGMESIALDELTALAAGKPQDIVVQLGLAQAHEREGNLAEAAAAYATALARNPALSVAAKRLAELYSGPLRDADKALGYARQARQLAPNDPAIASLLGQLVLDSGEYPLAYNLLHDAARMGQRDAGTLVGLGHAAYSQGLVDEARTAMTDALAAQPDPDLAAQATAFLALTTAPAEGVAPDPAAAEAALADNPRSVPALMVRASAQLAAADTDAARKTYEEILGIHPAFLPAQKRLAVLLGDDPASRDRAHELAVALRRALPDDPDVAELLGTLSYHRKDYTFALQMLGESHRRRPLAPAGIYYQGLAQRETGDTDASIASLESALSAGLAEPLATEARTALEALRQPQ